MDALQNTISAKAEQKVAAVSGGGAVDSAVAGIEKKLLERQSRFEGALMQVWGLLG